MRVQGVHRLHLRSRSLAVATKANCERDLLISPASRRLGGDEESEDLKGNMDRVGKQVNTTS